jgi:hypothetical protein
LFLPDFKIWHQASKSGQGELAAEAGSKILEFFEKTYNVPYPLSKMDMAGKLNSSSVSLLLLSLYLSLSLCLCLSLSVYLFVWLSLSVCLYLFVFVYLTDFDVKLFVFFSVCLCVCFKSLSLSPFQLFPTSKLERWKTGD